MTEAEWLSASKPEMMFQVLQGRTTVRKCQCFALACMPVILRYLGDERSKRALVELSRFVDGESSPEELEAAGLEAVAAVNSSRENLGPHREDDLVHLAAEQVAYSFIKELDRLIHFMAMRFCYFRIKAGNLKKHAKILDQEYRRQVRLVHEIFGNPFRPVTVDPNWFTTGIIDLASNMYRSQDFSAMPVLADALQDVGCENEDILAHCRGPGPHVKGCWVVDLLLGKE